MRRLLPIILLFFCTHSNAQPLLPPLIQWQKCFGGSLAEATLDMQPTSDGGFIVAGSAESLDGDLSSQTIFGFIDVWIVKFDIAGNMQWQKNFGGSLADYAASIQQTNDGGYIVLGATNSADGQVVGHHGFGYDLWVLKLDASGNMQWQKCLGGSAEESAGNIIQTSGGGYILTGSTYSIDGDVSGNHSGTVSPDCWVVQLDASGTIQWQKCFGGNNQEDAGQIQQTADGGYILATDTRSKTGNVSGNTYDLCTWLVKLDAAGGIQWQKFFDSSAFVSRIRLTGGGFIISANGWIDGAILNLDASGNLIWRRELGGSSDELSNDIRLTADGGYIVSIRSRSSDGDLCKNYGSDDFWIVKLDAGGDIEWQKSYGGSAPDFPAGIFQLSDGSYIAAGATYSNDNDVSGNHSAGSDMWIIHLTFPGVSIVAGVSIVSDLTTVCPGGNIKFAALPVNGGTDPTYQWKVNGINISQTGDTVVINNFNNGDQVNCVMTSNLACITVPDAISNSIGINIDPSLKFSGFLPPDTVKCNFGSVELSPLKNYSSYLWNNNETTRAITVDKAGTYWLQVTDSNSCIGKDTIIVTGKDCLEGLYVPTAFTPNGDGKNDLFKPRLIGDVQEYKFVIYNRWGQIVFQTSDLTKAWDGARSGIPQDSNSFVWVCTYQLRGKKLTTEKGTVTMIR